MKKGFISYARGNRQRVQTLLNNLRSLERNGEIEFFDDYQISPGDEWETTTAKALEQADLILICVSDHLLGSEFIYDNELEVALRRHDEGKARVVPVILTYCSWEDFSVRGRPLGSLQAVPRDGSPIQSFRPASRGYKDAADRIKAVVRELR